MDFMGFQSTSWNIPSDKHSDIKNANLQMPDLFLHGDFPPQTVKLPEGICLDVPIHWQVRIPGPWQHGSLP